jgi:hypothetical protein
MVALALMFLPDAALRRARPIYALVLAYLLAMIFGKPAAGVSRKDQLCELGSKLNEAATLCKLLSEN